MRVRLHPQLHHLSAQLALFLTEPHHAHSWRSRTNEDEIKRRCREHWKDLYRDGPSLGSPRRLQPAEHLLLLSLARRQDRRQQPLLRIQLAGILRRASSSFQRASPRSLRSPRSRTTSPFFLCSTSRWTRLPGSLVRELYPAKGPPHGLSRRGSDRSSRQFSARRRLFEAPEFTPGREALYINARIFGLWGESPFLIGTRERSRSGPRVLEEEEVRHLMVGIWPRCRGSFVHGDLFAVQHPHRPREKSTVGFLDFATARFFPDGYEAWPIRSAGYSRYFSQPLVTVF